MGLLTTAERPLVTEATNRLRRLYRRGESMDSIYGPFSSLGSLNRPYSDMGLCARAWVDAMDAPDPPKPEPGFFRLLLPSFSMLAGVLVGWWISCLMGL